MSDKMYSDWQKTYFCISCDKEMSFDTKMDNQGTCPYCGHTTKGTVVHTKVKAKRLVSERIEGLKWYQFPKWITYFEYKEDK